MTQPVVKKTVNKEEKKLWKKTGAILHWKNHHKEGKRETYHVNYVKKCNISLVIWQAALKKLQVSTIEALKTTTVFTQAQNRKRIFENRNMTTALFYCFGKGWFRTPTLQQDGHCDVICSTWSICQDCPLKKILIKNNIFFNLTNYNVQIHPIKRK